MEKELLIRFLKCETSAQEEVEVLAWLEANAAHREEMDRLDKLFTAAVLHAPAAAEVRRRRVFGSPALRRLVRAAAAAAAVLLLSASAGWLFSTQRVRALSERTMAVSVPAGQRMQMTLPDGSSIWLNAGTTLEYPALFTGRERRVKLSGEALFDVEHAAEQPFVVETFACEVRVLGTKFDIAADEAAGTFSAALMRGSVQVVSRLNGEQMTLRPAECAELVNGHLSRTPIDDPDEFLWTEGIISLQNASFREVLDRIGKACNLRVEVRRGELPQLSCRGKIRISEGVDHAMRILQTGADFSYEIDYDTYTLVIR